MFGKINLAAAVSAAKSAASQSPILENVGDGGDGAVCKINVRRKFSKPAMHMSNLLKNIG